MERSQAVAAEGVPDSAAPTVLVVDDELLARETLRDILEAQGYDVITVADAEAVPRHLDDVDLILLDAMLPDKDGWTVCGEIKAVHPLLPIIMVTARTAPEDIVRTFEAGADDYVAKPFQVAELTARIESRLRAHRAEQALQEANRQASELADQNYSLYQKARQDAEERAALLRELDHRVRNNLSVIMGLVSMERNREPARSTEDALTSLESRLRAFLMVYEALRRRGYRGVPLKEIAERLAQRLRNIQDPAGGIELEVAGQEVTVDEHTGFAVGLALNEILRNALRHARERDARVTVHVEPAGDAIRISVADNGPGIPEDTDVNVRGSGLAVVRSLVEGELDGAVEIASNDEGTTVTLACPFGGRGA